jgi:hypothetical protein
VARVLGYGGIANTNGARDFSGKAVEVVSAGGSVAIRREVQIPGRLNRYRYGYRYIRILTAVLW